MFHQLDFLSISIIIKPAQESIQGKVHPAAYSAILFKFFVFMKCCGITLLYIRTSLNVISTEYKPAL
jgi:hypothetical protein